jgi:hypothetical protein
MERVKDHHFLNLEYCTPVYDRVNFSLKEMYTVQYGKRERGPHNFCCCPMEVRPFSRNLVGRLLLHKDKKDWERGLEGALIAARGGVEAVRRQFFFNFGCN